MRSAAVLAAAALALSGSMPGQVVAAEPDRVLAYDADEVTWPQLDLAPDGRTILFDLLGDIYRIPAAGGDATAILTGPAWERDAVLSPDGKWMAFISDRSGTTNLWLARPDGSDSRMLSDDTSLVLYTSPAWSPDGRSVYVSRTVHRVLAFELWRFALAGGKPEVVVEARPAGNEGWDERVNALGAAPTPDGHAIYYATKRGHTWTEGDPPTWSIARQDLATGTVETVVPGGMRPVLSPDGRKLAYAARKGPLTGLRLRDLTTGEDRWLAFPVDRDGQEGGYYYDLLPRYEFTPDGKALVLAKQGKFHRLDIAGGESAEIAFKAPVRLALRPQTRVAQPVDSGPVVTRLAEGAVPSPDGRAIAFASLGTLYVRGADGDSKVLATGNAFAPAWLPDGKAVAYIDWTAAHGGQLRIVPVAKGKPRAVGPRGPYWQAVLAERGGNSLLALRANHYERLRAPDEIAPAYPTDLVRMPLGRGSPEVLAHGVGLKSLQQTADGAIWVQTPAGLAELVDGKLVPRIAIVTKPMGQYIEGTAPAADILVAPDRRHLLARAANQLYLVPMPPLTATAPTLDLQKPAAGQVKVTRAGADRAFWSADGAAIGWTAGADLFVLPIATALAAPDGERMATVTSLATTRPRAMPSGPQMLRGATVLTMDGDRVVEDADVAIVADRITAIGPRGTVAVPDGADVRNLAGKFIIPGLVDAHAHFIALPRVIHDGTHWAFPVNLAFGVTSVLEVQAFTPDIFAYADRIDAGMLAGPRVFSTGQGVFVDSLIESEADAAAILSRYRDRYRTRNIKSYMVGDRKTRQSVADASRALGMMPTTEGAADRVLELTHAVDGFAGNEHAIPITPIHDDIVRLFVASGISYNPTLGVVYGGNPAVFDDIIRKRPEDDPRLTRFMPPFQIARNLRNRHWMPSELQTYHRFAADALRIRRAGGLVGAGSHGEIQGLGMIWELEAFVAGGASPMEAIAIGTIGSAEVIGRAGDIGSLAPGKLADLVVLGKDPRTDIANLRSIEQVMRGGVLYDGATLAPLNRPGTVPTRWWLDDEPTRKAAQ